MKCITSVIFVCIFLKISAFAQHEPVFPGQQGQALLDNLVASYKPLVLLPQAQARDTLFARIYAWHDSLTCVYTGYRVWLDPDDDPTQAAFGKGINTEHTFPQSLGATGVAEGDMHHLYPTREDVNAARGNLPFAEIPDAQTEDWYYLGQQLSNVPASNVALYSERRDGQFEPREDHKGNVARAMFYFYTMYRGQADAASPTFFESQRQTLCAWHLLDPVDAAEWSRTHLIAPYQQDKPNPFVLDCTLPERCYCTEFGQACTPAATGESVDNQLFAKVSAAPNPLVEATTLRYTLAEAGHVRLVVFDAFGKKLEDADLGWLAAGPHETPWTKKADAASGICFFRLVFENTSGLVGSATGRLVLLPRH